LLVPLCLLGKILAGIYHARVILPPTYPLSPPDIQILTHSGRFETQKNICIDGVTSFHTSSWRPIWGIRTVVVGLGGFWNATGPEAESGYGGLKVGGEERRRLAGM
jgi:ubiquitin-conjugating enzyme E2 J1